MEMFVRGILTMGLCALCYIQNTHAEDLPGEMYHKAIVYANASHVCVMDARAFVNNTYDVHCIFTVLKQPTVVTPPGRQDTTAAPIRTALPIDATTTPSHTATHDDSITMFDMNIQKRILYFVSVDNTIYERDLELPTTSDVKVLIIRVPGNISGLAYDTGDTNNLYWCESDPGVVKVVNVETKSLKEISPNNTTLISPRNMIFLLKTRKLAWIAGTTNASIQTMTTDGADIEVVYEHTADISSLIFDEDDRLFYFLSQSKVYSVMFDGSARKEVAIVESTAYKLLLYDGYIAWLYTNTEHNNLMKVIRLDTAGIVRGNSRYLDRVSTIVDIKVLDARLPSTNISKSTCADSSLSHGHVAEVCGKQVGKTCMYTCDQYYTNITYKAVCTNDFRWHPLNACTKHIILPTPAENMTLGTGIIMAILVLFIIILATLAVIGFILGRKKIKKASSKYTIASFRHRDDRIAIANINFEDIDMPATPKNEHRYQTLFGKEGAAAVNDGLMKYAYNHDQDPLSAAGRFGVTRDRAILTYEAWLMEREKWTKTEYL